jgi:hypothetical protein
MFDASAGLVASTNWKLLIGTYKIWHASIGKYEFVCSAEKHTIYYLYLQMDIR